MYVKNLYTIRKKMKSKILLTGFLLISMAGFGQRIGDCDPGMIEKIDSVVNYVKEVNADIYTPVDVFIYELDRNDHYTEIERLSLPSRVPVNRQNYFFDPAGRKTYYILQYWDGEGYYDSGRSDYYFNDQGYLEREVFSGMADGVWVPYQQHWYNYDEGNVTQTYLRQMVNAAGEWYDFSYKNYIYNETGKLVERNEQRIADGVIFWAELFTYDPMGRTSTRVRQSLKYSPATRTYVMMDLNKQIYSYDIYGELSEYQVETWIDNSWTITGKSVYYRSLLKGRKVAVCHNGKTLWLPAPAIVAHLRHGDQLGCCECQENPGHNQENIPGKKENQDFTIVVFPNPTSSEITVYLPELPGKASGLTLHNRNGSLVMRNKIAGQSETFNISHLKPGSYLLTVECESGTFTKTVIKK